MGAAAASGAGLTMMLVAGAGLAAASANAPNPVQAVTGGVSNNPDGSATVSLHGNWSWDVLTDADQAGATKSSPQLQCQSRYGVGWAVDWWGTDTQAPSFSVQNDAYQLASGPQNPSVAFSQGGSAASYAGAITEVAAAGIPLSKVGAAGNFWVGGVAAGNAPGYAGATNAVYDGFDAPLCGQTAPDGAPLGTWSAQATYPSLADVPKVLCVNFYDMHQSENHPPAAGGSDWSPARDGDNSIQTNDYNPNLGGNCFATPGLTPVTPTITVDKTNNAAGTGYGKTEQAPEPGATVPFRVTVTNTSPFPLVIQSISDAYSGQTISPSCAQAFVGQTLAASGQSDDDATCDFTLTNYAPPAGQSLVDTATVVAQVPGSSNSSTGVSASSTSATGSSTSTVTTPSQSAAGSILLCNGQMPTTTVVNGGTIKLLSPTGTQLADASDQLGATSVDQAGTYTLDATAPTGYDFVACGQSVVSIPNPASSASQPIVVPAGGSGTGVFYVTPIDKPTQTISGSILACPNGTPTTTPVNGGSLLVTDATGATALQAADQLSTSGVSAGTYKVTATAPDGDQFVSCGQDDVTVAQPASSASRPVVVPSGGTGSAVFYVAPVLQTPKVLTQTLSGTILACGQDGQPTTDPVTGGSLAILSGDQTVVTSPDQLAATSVPAGTYTLAANAPSGYDLVACGQPSVSIASPATAATEPVLVPAGSSGQGTFYVAPIPAQVLGETLTAAPPAGSGPVVAPSSLAFTGPPPALRLMLLLGLSFLSAGCFLLWVTRPRQTVATGA